MTWRRSRTRALTSSRSAVSGLNIMATRLMPGAISLSNSSILLVIDASKTVNPVRLPPGWDRLATKRELIGSLTSANTIGMVCVSRASAEVTGVEVASSTSGCKPMSSPATSICCAHSDRRALGRPLSVVNNSAGLFDHCVQIKLSWLLCRESA
jgi:hypothetical protein